MRRPGPLGIGKDEPFPHDQRLVALIKLDTVLVRHAAIGTVQKSQPALGLGAARARSPAEKQLVHIALSCPWIDAGDDGHRRRGERAMLGHAGAGHDLGDGGCVALMMRSLMLEVATEQLTGVARHACDAVLPEQNVYAALGAPVFGDRVIDAVEQADHCARSRRAFCLIQAARQIVEVVAQVDLDAGLVGQDPHLHLDGNAILGRSGEGVVDADRDGFPTRHLPDRRDHALLAVVEPLFRERMKAVPPHLRAKCANLTLPDARRAEHAEKIPVPLLRHADSHLAHTDDVLIQLTVFLHTNAREDQRSLLIDVARVAEIGRGNGVSRIGLVGLGHHGEVMLTVIIEDRDQDAVVGRVRAAVVGRVVEKCVARLEIGMQLVHRADHHLGAEHVGRAGSRPRRGAGNRA